MNRVYLHNNESIKKIVTKYLIGLLPLVLYGFYKNGILLYRDDLVSFVDMFNVFYLLIISILLLLITNFFFKKKIFENMSLVLVCTVPLFMPPSINLLVYAISLFLSLIIINVLPKKINYNKIAFVILFILIIINMFEPLSYLNSAEKLNIYALNFFDLICGRTIGGIASSNILLGIIVLFYYAFFNNYKKVIAFSSLLAFVIIMILINNFDINELIASNAILALILIAPDTISTPAKFQSMVIYGLILGILTGLLTSFISFNIGVFIAILICSFTTPILVKLTEKW